MRQSECFQPHIIPIDAPRPIRPLATEFLRPREVVRSAETKRTGEKQSNTERLLSPLRKRAGAADAVPTAGTGHLLVSFPAGQVPRAKRKKFPLQYQSDRGNQRPCSCPLRVASSSCSYGPYKSHLSIRFAHAPVPNTPRQNMLYSPGWTLGRRYYGSGFFRRIVPFDFLIHANTEALSGGGKVLTCWELTAPPG